MLPRLKRLATRAALLFLVVAFCGETLSQFGGGGRRGRGAPAFSRGSVPEWELEPKFKQDCFTFVRIKYRSTRDSSSWAWWTDYPDAEVNMSWRLHELTSMKVDPNGKVIDLLDEDLFNYPFAFMSGVPAIIMSDEEIKFLRQYLVRGGFVMVDDFWGEANWAHFEREVLDRLFPGQKAQELPLEHPIFNCVFQLKEKPQIPNYIQGIQSRDSGVTWEVPDGRTPHYRAMYDDKGRIVMLICHNTDLGDGWEEEGRDPYYFTEFSEKKAYPLGINIIFYALTH
jgi:hypothetical protein